jgi:Fuc2NAc and GlcNAc transferase
VNLLFVGAAAAVAAALMTAGARRLAIKRAILDVPSERSLHGSPTPTAGGVSVAVVVALALAWLGWSRLLDATVVAGLAGGAVVVATIGWIDDLKSLPSTARAVAQTMAAAWFLWWTGGVDALRLGQRTIELGAAGSVLALLGMTWSINLYNFMDGIDGIAGGQAVVAAAFGATFFAGVAPGLSLLSAAIAGSSLGFLAWNWSPARIFMGDVGSGLLGFLFAALALLSERGGGAPLLSWVLLGGVFIFDATVTLVRRMAKGERWYAAHKRHAYQRAVRSGWSHARVSSGVIALSAVLGLLGVTVARHPDLLLPCVGGALALLTTCYLWIEKRLPMRPEPANS